MVPPAAHLDARPLRPAQRGAAGVPEPTPHAQRGAGPRSLARPAAVAPGGALGGAPRSRRTAPARGDSAARRLLTDVVAALRRGARAADHTPTNGPRPKGRGPQRVRARFLRPD